MTQENSETPSYLTRQTKSGEAQIAYFYHAFKSDKMEKRSEICPTVVLCGGFNSNMRGSKAEYLKEFCAKNGWDFCRFDYQGHGESSGQFIEGTIGDWFQDALSIVTEKTSGPLLVVGSSMGGWMSLLLAKTLPERVKGLVLIAPAPDFPKELMMKAFSDEIKAEIEEKGVWYRPSEFEGEDAYPITKKLIEESVTYNLLETEIPFTGPVHILHGSEDEVVPLAHAFRTMEALVSKDVTVEVVKHGDHRLSTPTDLHRLGLRVKEMMHRFC